jgi:hypothetical protein
MQIADVYPRQSNPAAIPTLSELELALDSPPVHRYSTADQIAILANAFASSTVRLREAFPAHASDATTIQIPHAGAEDPPPTDPQAYPHDRSQNRSWTKDRWHTIFSSHTPTCNRLGKLQRRHHSFESITSPQPGLGRKQTASLTPLSRCRSWVAGARAQRAFGADLPASSAPLHLPP